MDELVIKVKIWMGNVGRFFLDKWKCKLRGVLYEDDLGLCGKSEKKFWEWWQGVYLKNVKQVVWSWM